ncbi:hypothetical protein PXH69_24765 [Rhodococcus qingshengii]|uniref:Uncharacterized protein n=1 Tax=Rhodococcus qingshengii TaxID=334542 RepID=A0AAW6LMF7_RHOSG|nr:hypothetical protein [Rhodococcus qingshengii]MDE8648184.1 hypothetical protein [Rhodococcus qingshengii]
MSAEAQTDRWRVGATWSLLAHAVRPGVRQSRNFPKGFSAACNSNTMVLLPDQSDRPAHVSMVPINDLKHCKRCTDIVFKQTANTFQELVNAE